MHGGKVNKEKIRSSRVSKEQSGKPENKDLPGFARLAEGNDNCHSDLSGYKEVSKR